MRPLPHEPRTIVIMIRMPATRAAVLQARMRRSGFESLSPTFDVPGSRIAGEARQHKYAPLLAMSVAVRRRFPLPDVPHRIRKLLVTLPFVGSGARGFGCG